MKMTLVFLAASLVVSLASSVSAQSSSSGDNSKITATAVSTQQLPKSFAVAKLEAEKKSAFQAHKALRVEKRDRIEARRIEKREAAKERALDRRQAKEQRIAERRHMEVKQQVMNFRDNHPLAAHEIVAHKPWLKNHGISPVKLTRNPQALRDRMIERRSK